MNKDTRTDKELNRIIAEWCPDVVNRYYGPCGTNDFCNDLNAIHEAEKKLGTDWEMDVWFGKLDEIVNKGLPKFKNSIAGAIAVTQATARQRAEALVAIIEFAKP